MVKTSKKILYRRNNRLKLEMFAYPKYKKQLEDNSIQSFRYFENVSRIVDAIDESLDIISESYKGEEKVRMLSKHYFQKPPKNLVQLTMSENYSENTLRNWEMEFFDILSDCLGLSDFVI